MPTDRLSELKTRRNLLELEIRDIVISYLISVAEPKGIQNVIEDYADEILFLDYLNDIPVLMDHYGKSIATIKAIENPKSEVQDAPKPAEPGYTKSELLAMLKRSYESGESLPKLYQRVVCFDLNNEYHSLNCPSIVKRFKWMWRAFKVLLLPIWVWREQFDNVLSRYATLTKSENFSQWAKRPLKDRCLALLDEMEAMFGVKGVLVRPDKKVLLKERNIRDFIGVSAITSGRIALPKELEATLQARRDMLACVQTDIDEILAKAAAAQEAALNEEPEVFEVPIDDDEDLI